MTYRVTGFNNFCRVFRLPSQFSNEYCFGGGIPTTFKMVDWFCPVPGLPQWAISQDEYNKRVSDGSFADTSDHTKEINGDELQKQLNDFLCQKDYIQPGFKYVVICDFGFSFMLNNSLSEKLLCQSH